MLKSVERAFRSISMKQESEGSCSRVRALEVACTKLTRVCPLVSIPKDPEEDYGKEEETWSQRTQQGGARGGGQGGGGEGGGRTEGVRRVLAG